jgi:hypothetical protein
LGGNTYSYLVLVQDKKEDYPKGGQPFLTVERLVDISVRVRQLICNFVLYKLDGILPLESNSIEILVRH